jgi:hypothetical protein
MHRSQIQASNPRQHRIHITNSWLGVMQCWQIEQFLPTKSEHFFVPAIIFPRRVYWCLDLRDMVWRPTATARPLLSILAEYMTCPWVIYIGHAHVMLVTLQLHAVGFVHQLVPTQLVIVEQRLCLSDLCHRHPTGGRSLSAHVIWK